MDVTKLWSPSDGQRRSYLSLVQPTTTSTWCPTQHSSHNSVWPRPSRLWCANLQDKSPVVSPCELLGSKSAVRRSYSGTRLYNLSANTENRIVRSQSLFCRSPNSTNVTDVDRGACGQSEFGLESNHESDCVSLERWRNAGLALHRMLTKKSLCKQSKTNHSRRRSKVKTDYSHDDASDRMCASESSNIRNIQSPNSEFDNHIKYPNTQSLQEGCYHQTQSLHDICSDKTQSLHDDGSRVRNDRDNLDGFKISFRQRLLSSSPEFEKIFPKMFESLTSENSDVLDNIISQSPKGIFFMPQCNTQCHLEPQINTQCHLEPQCNMPSQMKPQSDMPSLIEPQRGTQSNLESHTKLELQYNIQSQIEPQRGLQSNLESHTELEPQYNIRSQIKPQHNTQFKLQPQCNIESHLEPQCKLKPQYSTQNQNEPQCKTRSRIEAQYKTPMELQYKIQSQIQPHNNMLSKLESQYGTDYQNEPHCHTISQNGTHYQIEPHCHTNSQNGQQHGTDYQNEPHCHTISQNGQQHGTDYQNEPHCHTISQNGQQHGTDYQNEPHCHTISQNGQQHGTDYQNEPHCHTISQNGQQHGTDYQNEPHCHTISQNGQQHGTQSKLGPQCEKQLEPQNNVHSQNEAHTKLESHYDTQFQMEPQHGMECQLKPLSNTQSEREPQCDVQSQIKSSCNTQSQREPQSDIQSQIKSSSNTQSQREPQSDIRSQIKSSNTQSQREPQSDIQSKIKSSCNTQSQREPQSDIRSQIKSSNTQSQREPQSDIQSKIKSSSNTQSQREPQSDIRSQIKSSCNTQYQRESQSDIQSQIKSSSNTQSQREPQSDIQSQIKSSCNTQSQREPQSDIQSQIKSSCNTQSQREPQSDIQSQIKSSSNTQSQREPQSDIQSQIKSSCNTQSQREPQSDIRSQIKSSCNTQSQREPQSDIQSQIKSSCNTQSQREPQSDIQSQIKSSSNTQSQREPQSDIQSKIKSSCNTQSQMESCSCIEKKFNLSSESSDLKAISRPTTLDIVNSHKFCPDCQQCQTCSLPDKLNSTSENSMEFHETGLSSSGVKGEFKNQRENELYENPTWTESTSETSRIELDVSPLYKNPTCTESLSTSTRNVCPCRFCISRIRDVKPTELDRNRSSLNNKHSKINTCMLTQNNTLPCYEPTSPSRPCSTGIHRNRSSLNDKHSEINTCMLTQTHTLPCEPTSPSRPCSTIICDANRNRPSLNDKHSEINTCMLKQDIKPSSNEICLEMNTLLKQDGKTSSNEKHVEINKSLKQDVRTSPYDEDVRDGTKLKESCKTSLKEEAERLDVCNTNQNNLKQTFNHHRFYQSSDGQMCNKHFNKSTQLDSGKVCNISPITLETDNENSSFIDARSDCLHGGKVKYCLSRAEIFGYENKCLAESGNSQKSEISPLRCMQDELEQIVVCVRKTHTANQVFADASCYPYERNSEMLQKCIANNYSTDDLFHQSGICEEPSEVFVNNYNNVQEKNNTDDLLQIQPEICQGPSETFVIVRQFDNEQEKSNTDSLLQVQPEICERPSEIFVRQFDNEQEESNMDNLLQVRPEICKEPFVNVPDDLLHVRSVICEETSEVFGNQFKNVQKKNNTGLLQIHPEMYKEPTEMFGRQFDNVQEKSSTFFMPITTCLCPRCERKVFMTQCLERQRPTVSNKEVHVKEKCRLNMTPGGYVCLKEDLCPRCVSIFGGCGWETRPSVSNVEEMEKPRLWSTSDSATCQSQKYMSDRQPEKYCLWSTENEATCQSQKHISEGPPEKYSLWSAENDATCQIQTDISDGPPEKYSLWSTEDSIPCFFDGHTLEKQQSISNSEAVVRNGPWSIEDGTTCQIQTDISDGQPLEKSLWSTKDSIRCIYDGHTLEKQQSISNSEAVVRNGPWSIEDGTTCQIQTDISDGQPLEKSLWSTKDSIPCFFDGHTLEKQQSISNSEAVVRNGPWSIEDGTTCQIQTDISDGQPLEKSLWSTKDSIRCIYDGHTLEKQQSIPNSDEVVRDSSWSIEDGTCQSQTDISDGQPLEKSLWSTKDSIRCIYDGHTLEKQQSIPNSDEVVRDSSWSIEDGMCQSQTDISDGQPLEKSLWSTKDSIRCTYDGHTLEKQQSISNSDEVVRDSSWSIEDGTCQSQTDISDGQAIEKSLWSTEDNIPCVFDGHSNSEEAVRNSSWLNGGEATYQSIFVESRLERHPSITNSKAVENNSLCLTEDDGMCQGSFGGHILEKQPTISKDEEVVKHQIQLTECQRCQSLFGEHTEAAGQNCVLQLTGNYTNKRNCEGCQKRPSSLEIPNYNVSNGEIIPKYGLPFSSNCTNKCNCEGCQKRPSSLETPNHNVSNGEIIPKYGLPFSSNCTNKCTCEKCEKRPCSFEMQKNNVSNMKTIKKYGLPFASNCTDKCVCEQCQSKECVYGLKKSNPDISSITETTAKHNLQSSLDSFTNFNTKSERDVSSDFQELYDIGRHSAKEMEERKASYGHQLYRNYSCRVTESDDADCDSAFSEDSYHGNHCDCTSSGNCCYGCAFDARERSAIAVKSASGIRSGSGVRCRIEGKRLRHRQRKRFIHARKTFERKGRSSSSSCDMEQTVLSDDNDLTEVKKTEPLSSTMLQRYFLQGQNTDLDDLEMNESQSTEFESFFLDKSPNKHQTSFDLQISPLKEIFSSSCQSVGDFALTPSGNDEMTIQQGANNSVDYFAMTPGGDAEATVQQGADNSVDYFALTPSGDAEATSQQGADNSGGVEVEKSERSGSAGSWVRMIDEIFLPFEAMITEHGSDVSEISSKSNKVADFFRAPESDYPSSDSGDADDEFECDCEHCQLLRGSIHPTQFSATLAAGMLSSAHLDSLITEGSQISNPWETDWAASGDNDFDVSLDDFRPLEPFLLGLQQLPQDPIELMYQNVIMQMLTVHPELLGELAPPPVSLTVIDSLDIVIASKENTDTDLKCPICLCLFDEGEELTRLPCQHLYHPLCIQAWLVKSGTCPVCRHILQPEC